MRIIGDEINRLFVILVAGLGFGQINWEIETVDTVINPPNEFQYQNALALDTNEIPHIVFNKRNFSELIYATRISDNVWMKEFIDAGSFYACISLVFDKNNTPHCSYYQMIGQTAYLCHSYRDTLGWHKTIIDTIQGILTQYWFTFAYFRTSIDIDSFNNLGIAYVSFNSADSVFYIKYTHFDGSNWNTSIVEYDTGCSGINQPSDQSPSLKFDSGNIPYIAFHHIVGSSDTIKLAHWDDSLNKWVIERVLNNSHGCAAVALAINEQDDPYIAHGVDIGLYCSWRTMGTWYHEYTGIDVGWLEVRLSLDLDSNSNSHIFYHGIGPVNYCYKDTAWHDCGRLDSTLDNLGDINLSLNSRAQPNVSFRFGDWDSVTQTNYSGIKYAKGTFVGIEENDAGYRTQDTGCRLGVYPNICYGTLNIKYTITRKGKAELAIYAVSGAKIKSIKMEICLPGNYQKTINLGDLATGIYFVVFKQNNEQVSKKFLFIR